MIFSSENEKEAEVRGADEPTGQTGGQDSGTRHQDPLPSEGTSQASVGGGRGGTGAGQDWPLTAVPRDELPMTR